MKSQSNLKKFILLWAGELISSIGGGLTSFGLGVYIFQRTGSAASMALVTLLGFLPTLLLSVPAGALADRYDRRLLMMIGDGCSALGIVYILICMMNGGASLTQICVGVLISSVFSALLEPAFRATITDLLTKEEFSKASGLVSLAGSARYLLSPILAGFLLTVSDVKLLLAIDIGTFFLTVVSAAVVRRSIGKKAAETATGFLASIREGWQILRARKGVLLLVLVSSAITLFMGMFQILAEPMMLSFTDAKTLGVAETVCASGMLASGLVLGVRGIKRHFTGVMSASLALAGLMVNPLYVVNFFVSGIPLGFIITWVYLVSDRSILACMVFHLFVNFMQEKIAMTPETKCLETIVVTAAAAVIVLANRDLFFGTRHVGRLLDAQALNPTTGKTKQGRMFGAWNDCGRLSDDWEGRR